MSTMPPTVFCLTPVKNEAWILDRFIQCASTWADHIIIADQHSTDGSREIAQSYDKVKLITNDLEAYDEQGRQKLLIEAARGIPVKNRRILIALDADEILTANWMDSPEWDTLLRAPQGCVLRFRWANVAPSIKTGWVPDQWIPFGFVDDGSPHEGRKIHSPRIPTPENSPSIDFEAIHVLHYQYANWERMKSKQRWYQCYECLEFPEKRPITIYRQYHHMDSALDNAEPLPKSWFTGYEKQGIDMTTIPTKDYYYWDKELVSLFHAKGTEPFAKVAVWDPDWTELSKAIDPEDDTVLSDPRSTTQRFIHDWLAKTQHHSDTYRIRLVQKILQLAGW